MRKKSSCGREKWGRGCRNKFWSYLELDMVGELTSNFLYCPLLLLRDHPYLLLVFSSTAFSFLFQIFPVFSSSFLRFYGLSSVCP